tara:strand:+ start:14550 stop:15437 length:888 start_codon:yes stop_codon:yes gene_type:complete
MPEAVNGTTTIHYDTKGDRENPSILLIMGYTEPMTSFRDGFCQLLVDAGYHVIRFDNRDVGLTSKTQGDPPDLQAVITAVMTGQTLPKIPYTIEDMASDAFAVLDAAGVSSAHIVGVSMGGNIAQTMAITNPRRVASMISIMSTTGAPGVGIATPEVGASLKSPLGIETKEEAVECSLHNYRLFAGPLFDEEAHKNLAASNYERNWNPLVTVFQLAAMLAGPDRTDDLQSIEVPTLVIHGAKDTLVQVDGGKATSAAIKNSRLVIFDEMGHEMPEILWCDITTEILNHVQASERA